ncbi:hypothetical protein Q1695_013574 [Nippostrongylus brasiliensis]|nr:hypothetical protein Q1695_013574 [Nippostrongylus brasiliensis]
MEATRRFLSYRLSQSDSESVELLNSKIKLDSCENQPSLSPPPLSDWLKKVLLCRGVLRRVLCAVAVGDFRHRYRRERGQEQITDFRSVTMFDIAGRLEAQQLFYRVVDKMCR